jgi:hypothetical protein
MRRFLLTLTLLSFSGLSQPAQQQAQPPIVVKLEMPPTSHRDRIDLLEAFGPPIAAVVALIIGLTQLWLQREQLKQDLFDKRYKVYALTRDFAVNALRVGIGGDEAINTFSNGTAHAEFLFHKDVLEFIGSIKDISRALAPVQAADVTGTSSLHHDLKLRMLRKIDSMNAVFRPYLR